VVAGQDELAGGSWMGLNDFGVTAAILNRYGTLGPAPGKRSRGELVLEALDHAEAEMAARALLALEPTAYRPFNMFVADAGKAFWLKNDGEKISAFPVLPGLHMLTAYELDDEASARIRAFLPRFAAAAIPDPDSDDWREWSELLGTRSEAMSESEETASMCLALPSGFGTVSAALLALPADPETLPIFNFAAGKPGEAPFLPVRLS
jgi:uncharacterized protein with NRDE domain